MGKEDDLFEDNEIDTFDWGDDGTSAEKETGVVQADESEEQIAPADTTSIEIAEELEDIKTDLVPKAEKVEKESRGKAKPKAKKKPKPVKTKVKKDEVKSEVKVPDNDTDNDVKQDDNYTDPAKVLEEDIVTSSTTLVSWVISIIISALPVIGVVFLILWCTEKHSYHPDRKVWAQAMLIIILVVFVFFIGVTMVAGTSVVKMVVSMLAKK